MPIFNDTLSKRRVCLYSADGRLIQNARGDSEERAIHFMLDLMTPTQFQFFIISLSQMHSLSHRDSQKDLPYRHS